MIGYVEEKVTPEEKDLIDDVRDLQYGEIYDIELDKGGQPNILVSLSRPQHELVKLIREGMRFFHSVKVHQGEPAYAEVPGQTKRGKYRCKRLLKLN